VGGSKLQKGTKIEARRGGRPKWVTGTVICCRANGTYDINYDADNETCVEACVPRNLIREVGSVSVSQSPPISTDADGNTLQEGMKIEARHGGRSKWFKGTVARCRPNGSYDINYDDGDRETGVPRDLIRNVGISAAAAADSGGNSNIESFFEDVFEELTDDFKRQKSLDAALRRQPRSTVQTGDRKQQLLGIIRDGFSKRGEPVPLAIPSMTIEQLERVVKVWKLQ
jgi:hypothetical protein